MKGRYPIRVAARLTGVGVDTLRAWERRYGAVTPARAGDSRLYSDADVSRLRLMRDAVQAGYRVGGIAALGDGDLRRLVDAPAATPRPGTRAPLDTSAFTAALTSLDTPAIDREFARLGAVLPPLELVQDAVLPALRTAGDRWNRRRGGIAQEHALSSALRHLLGSFLRIHARRDAEPRLLFATPAGDRHEIGILCAAMLAASAGLGVSYLGPDLPAGDIVAAVKASNARVLVLGMTFAASDAAMRKEVRSIGRALPAKVEIWAGGARSSRVAPAAGRALVLEDFEACLTQIIRLGGRRP